MLRDTHLMDVTLSVRKAAGKLKVVFFQAYNRMQQCAAIGLTVTRSIIHQQRGKLTMAELMWHMH